MGILRKNKSATMIGLFESTAHELRTKEDPVMDAVADLLASIGEWQDHIERVGPQERGVAWVAMLNEALSVTEAVRREREAK